MDDFYQPVLWDPHSPPSALLLGDRLVWCKGTLSRQDEIRAGLRSRYGDLREVLRSYAWLVREPTNAVDPFAVAVYFGREKVGFMPATLARVMAVQLDGLAESRLTFNGVPLGYPTCLCTLKTVGDGAWIVGLIGPWPHDGTRQEIGKQSPRRTRAAKPKKARAPAAKKLPGKWDQYGMRVDEDGEHILDDEGQIIMRPDSTDRLLAEEEDDE